MDTLQFEGDHGEGDARRLFLTARRFPVTLDKFKQSALLSLLPLNLAAVKGHPHPDRSRNLHSANLHVGYSRREESSIANRVMRPREELKQASSLIRNEDIMISISLRDNEISCPTNNPRENQSYARRYSKRL
jgi:hypothetical protein